MQKIHYLTFDLDQGHMKRCSVPSTSCATTFEVAMSNGLGGNNYKKRDGRTDAQTDRQPTDFGTKLIDLFF